MEIGTQGRIAVAAVLAGLAGLAANSAAVALALPDAPGFLALLLSPGRAAVAVIVAGLLPVVAARSPDAVRGLAALAALTVVPSLLAKWVFGIDAPWIVVLAANAVYAGAAWLAWRAVKVRLGVAGV